MTAAVRRVVLLLLLGGAGVSAAAPDRCENATRRLPTAELDQIYGDWVLVWAVGDTNKTAQILSGTNTSHAEIQLLEDNATVQFHERNLYQNNVSSCVSFDVRLRVNSTAEHLTLHTTNITVEADGSQREYPEPGEVKVYVGSADSLLLSYKEETGHYLLSYRRFGFHRDVDEHRAAHDFLKTHAECLEFPTEEAYVYDGVSDFCHKKSAPEAEPAES